MKSRLLTLAALTLALGSILSACGGDSTGSTDASSGGNTQASADKTSFSILIGKPEIAEQFEKTTKEYAQSHNVSISVIPLGNQTAYEKLATLYASNNAPTMMLLGQEIPDMTDKLVDLSDQPWVQHANVGTLDFVKDGDKIVGMPLTVEAFGLLYNKQVLDEAVGGSFDPSTIRTRDSLKELFDKIEATGKGAIHVSPMDWSLGAHLSNIFFTNQSPDSAERHAFLDKLKSGEADLSANTVYNGWADTFDLMKQYNQAKGSPLAPVYDDGTLALAGGEVGIWFMGNWAYPQLKEVNPDGEFGFLPVPISNNPEDYGNSQISVGVPSYWTIDATTATAEQQQAAKEFMNWLVSDPAGQDAYVNRFNSIPVFDNFTVLPEDSLSVAIMNYTSSGHTLEWMNTYYPVGGWAQMGASMQKYLSNTIDRAAFTKELQDYWTSLK